MDIDYIEMGILKINIGDLVWIISFILSGSYLYFRIYQRKYSWEKFIEIFPMMIVGGLFTGRFLHSFSPPLSMQLSGFNFSFYVTHLIDLVFVWDGGINLYGGLIGALIIGFSWFRYRGEDLWVWADILSLPLLLVASLSQLANFVNQSFYGHPEAYKFSVFIEPINRLQPYKLIETYKPLSLYGLGTGLALVVLLNVWEKKIKIPSAGGQLFGVTAVTSGFIYLTLEWYVLDSNLVLNGMLLSAMILIGGVVLLTKVGVFIRMQLP